MEGAGESGRCADPFQGIVVEVGIYGVFRVSPSLFEALNAGLFLQASSDNKLVVFDSTSVLKKDYTASS